jgi:carbon storage regulator
MLVLTRHLDESIRIGEGIRIKILSIDSNNVKIGIQAPKDVVVLREEIYEKIKTENVNASNINLISVKEVTDKIKKQLAPDEKNKPNSLSIINGESNYYSILLSTLSNMEYINTICKDLTDIESNISSDTYGLVIIDYIIYKKFSKLIHNLLKKKQFMNSSVIFLCLPESISEMKENKNIKYNIIETNFDEQTLKRKINSITKLKY